MQTDRDDAVAASDEWVVLSDALLAGMVHALNNRVTALSVCAELAAMGDEQMITGGVLAGEVARLQRACALLGLLPERVVRPEALELAPLLDDAIALHAHHPRFRAIECLVERQEGLAPVRAPRWALFRLLLVLVDAAKRALDDGAAPRIALRLSSDSEVVRLHVATTADAGAYGAALALRCGGAMTRDGDDLVLTLPTLAALRRRERDQSTPS
jgi:C4-dicarboxylate-specific signal transduction histidine kinase